MFPSSLVVDGKPLPSTTTMLEVRPSMRPSEKLGAKKRSTSGLYAPVYGNYLPGIGFPCSVVVRALKKLCPALLKTTLLQARLAWWRIPLLCSPTLSCVCYKALDASRETGIASRRLVCLRFLLTPRLTWVFTLILWRKV